MYCSNCGKENKESANYCVGCGSPLHLYRREAETPTDIQGGAKNYARDFWLLFLIGILVGVATKVLFGLETWPSVILALAIEVAFVYAFASKINEAMKAIGRRHWWWLGLLALIPFGMLIALLIVRAKLRPYNMWLSKYDWLFILLLVVYFLAIIFIFSAIVLVALGNARDKANDARIRSNLGQLRTLAEVHYDSNGSSYTNFGDCVMGSARYCQGDIADSVEALRSDTYDASGPLTAVSDASGFCLSSNLASDPNQYVCIDASGDFKEGINKSCGYTPICP